MNNFELINITQTNFTHNTAYNGRGGGLSMNSEQPSSLILIENSIIFNN